MYIHISVNISVCNHLYLCLATRVYTDNPSLKYYHMSITRRLLSCLFVSPDSNSQDLGPHHLLCIYLLDFNLSARSIRIVPNTQIRNFKTKYVTCVQCLFPQSSRLPSFMKLLRSAHYFSTPSVRFYRIFLRQFICFCYVLHPFWDPSYS